MLWLRIVVKVQVLVNVKLFLTKYITRVSKIVKLLLLEKMNPAINNKTILYLLISCVSCFVLAQHQDGIVSLKQGNVIGVSNLSSVWLLICVAIVQSKDIPSNAFPYWLKWFIISKVLTLSIVLFSWKYFRKHRERPCTHTWVFHMLNRPLDLCDLL